MTSDYIKQLEEQNEHLQSRLAQLENEKQLWDSNKPYWYSCKHAVDTEASYQYRTDMYLIAEIDEIFVRNDPTNHRWSAKFPSKFGIYETIYYDSFDKAKKAVEDTYMKDVENNIYKIRDSIGFFK